jgi:hypothetical protein
VRVRAAFAAQDVVDMVRTNEEEPGLLTTAGPLREQGLVSRHAGVGVTDAAVPSGRTVAREERPVTG